MESERHLLGVGPQDGDEILEVKMELVTQRQLDSDLENVEFDESLVAWLQGKFLSGGNCRPRFDVSDPVVALERWSSERPSSEMLLTTT